MPSSSTGSAFFVDNYDDDENGSTLTAPTSNGNAIGTRHHQQQATSPSTGSTVGLRSPRQQHFGHKPAVSDPFLQFRFPLHQQPGSPSQGGAADGLLLDGVSHHQQLNSPSSFGGSAGSSAGSPQQNQQRYSNLLEQGVGTSQHYYSLSSVDQRRGYQQQQQPFLSPSSASGSGHQQLLSPSSAASQGVTSTGPPPASQTHLSRSVSISGPVQHHYQPQQHSHQHHHSVVVPPPPQAGSSALRASSLHRPPATQHQSQPVLPSLSPALHQEQATRARSHSNTSSLVVSAAPPRIDTAAAAGAASSAGQAPRSSPRGEGVSSTSPTMDMRRGLSMDAFYSPQLGQSAASSAPASRQPSSSSQHHPSSHHQQGYAQQGQPSSSAYFATGAPAPASPQVDLGAAARAASSASLQAGAAYSPITGGASNPFESPALGTSSASFSPFVQPPHHQLQPSHTGGGSVYQQQQSSVFSTAPHSTAASPAFARSSSHQQQAYHHHQHHAEDARAMHARTPSYSPSQYSAPSLGHLASLGAPQSQPQPQQHSAISFYPGHIPSTATTSALNGTPQQQPATSIAIDLASSTSSAHGGSSFFEPASGGLGIMGADADLAAMQHQQRPPPSSSHQQRGSASSLSLSGRSPNPGSMDAGVRRLSGAPNSSGGFVKLQPGELQAVEQPQQQRHQPFSSLPPSTSPGATNPWTTVNAQPRGRRADAAARGRAFLSPLRALTTDLARTYALVNSEFRYELSHNPRRVLTKPSKPAGNNGFDNEDSDYILYVNDILGPEDKDR